jgi:hypothetical protein
MSQPAHNEVSPMQRTIPSLAFAVAALAITTQSASAGQFKKAVYYHAGQRPYRVVAAQLTASGNTDLVVADYLTSQIFVLLGNGNGTFRKSTKFSITSPVALAVGDLNGDGKEDLVVAEYPDAGESTVAVLLGDGTGKFRQSSSYPSGVETTGVAVADFNGDGHSDVVVANNSGNVMVFFGTGTGTLKRPSQYKIGDTPWAVAASDLNGDHHPDLAVTNISGYVSVLINDGTGKFLKPATYDAAGGEIVDLKIAGLRNNGSEDLVVADLSRGMVVLLNKGDGTFGKPTVYQPTFFNWQPPEACVIADFNLDGKLDVSCAAQAEDSYIFYGKGDGTFPSSSEIHNTIQNQGGYSIAAGDFNNDKAPDLAIPIELKGKVAIMLNTK